MQVIKNVFQSHGDDRGQLVVLEENRISYLEFYDYTTCMILFKLFLRYDAHKSLQ